MMVRPDFFVAEMLGWGMAGLGLIFIAELVLAAATLRHVVLFFHALLPDTGLAPESLGAPYGPVAALWGGLVAGLSGLAAVFCRDYLEKADLTAGPWAEHVLVYEMLTLLRYQYSMALFLPLTVGICGLAVWLYMYAYTRRRSTSSDGGS